MDLFAHLLQTPENNHIMKGLMLPKSHIMKNMSLVMYDQSHKFVILNYLTLKKWHAIYNERRRRVVENMPISKEWLQKVVQNAISKSHAPKDMVICLASSLSLKCKVLQFNSARKRTFCISSKDVEKKTTFDFSILE